VQGAVFPPIAANVGTAIDGDCFEALRTIV
jgi:hypothetical protein